MKMYEFGIENSKKILLLHGAGCTYKMWTPQIEMLQKEYHIYAPTLSGHTQGDEDFISSKEEATNLLAWFEEQDCKQILLVCGASLGAHVAAELLQQSPSFAEYAMIESLKAYQYKNVTLKVFCTLGKLMLRSCARTKGYMAGTYKQKIVSEDTKATIRNMSDTSLNYIMIESGNYRIKEQDIQITAKTYILYGSKEEKECKENTEILRKEIPDCQVKIIDGYKHGELAIGNPRRHVQILEELLAK